MSQQDVEAVGRLYEQFNRAGETGDFVSYVRNVYDPDCEYQPIEEEGSIRGHDAMVRWHQRWFEAWSAFHARADELIEVGDVVVAAITVDARGAGSETEVTQRFFHVWDLRDGKVLRVREYLERDEALEAAEAAEPAL